MDMAFFHSIWTVVLFINFIALLWWVYIKKSDSDFTKTANLIFDDDDAETSSQKGVNAK
nr:CcoQ/FixQ family Cbb3-type cytochrome c oxidase assembly chaperone [Candidatus Photodesmus katoptron]